MNRLDYCARSVAETLTFWNTSQIGLSGGEAAQRLVEYGVNEIEEKQLVFWDIIIRQFKSPLVYLLILAAGLDIVLRQARDGLIIGAIVLINASLGFVQEFRSERTLRLLRKYLVAKSRVRRDGLTILIESTQIVPGDIVELTTGNIIPADMRIIESEGLTVDESALSGESMAVLKDSRAMTPAPSQIFAARCLGFAGTTVVRGRGVGVVVGTGNRTLWGEIARDTTVIRRESGWEKDLNKFSGFILKLIMITLVGVLAANIFLKGRQANISELLIFSIALAVSVIPEALPVVITFSLSRGAARLVGRRVVVKRLSAIEDLGAIEVLCTDKTGTLTENKLKLVSVWGKEEAVVTEGIKVALPSISAHLPLDAFDTALLEKIGIDGQEQIKNKYEVIKEIPFDPELRVTSVSLRGPAGVETITRGAVEAILSHSLGLTLREKKEIDKWSRKQGSLGRRVIAVANNRKLTGLLSFSDPVKSTTRTAVHEAQKMGVRIIMLTGDSPVVAGVVAKEIGLISDQLSVVDGDSFEQMDAGEQHKLVEKNLVFARVTPSQKNKIIDLLQEKYRVGFLGEGINDGPALKSADVGLVVAHGADVAREAADIILLKKDLKVIVDGIGEGRIISGNIKKYITATLSSNMGNFYAVAVASLLIDFLPMLPIQILLLNLLSDLPMIAIATDNVDREELERPQVFGLRQLVWLAMILGIVSTVFDFMFFGLFYRQGAGTLQTAWFVGSVLTELVFVFSVRNKNWLWKGVPPSKILMGLTGLAGVLTLALPASRWGQEVFKFFPLATSHLGLILIVVAAYLISTELVKRVVYSKA